MQRDSGSHLPDPNPAPGTRVGIIAARFNGDVTGEMVEGCRTALEEFGVEADLIPVETPIEVCAGNPSRGSDRGDGLPLRDVVAGGHRDRIEMQIT